MMMVVDQQNKRRYYRCYRNKDDYWLNGQCDKEFDTLQKMLKHACDEHSSLELD
jgi:hypothetical protein